MKYDAGEATCTVVALTSSSMIFSGSHEMSDTIINSSDTTLCNRCFIRIAGFYVVLFEKIISRSEEVL